MPDQRYAAFCAGLPKAELHVHIEGTLTPAHRMELARRNQVRTTFDSIEAIEAARNFGGRGTPQTDLEEMLAYYYAGIEVLRTEQDFFDIGLAYLRQCRDDNVRYAEISFDPQAHTSRGVPFDDVVSGLHAAAQAGRTSYGVRAQLILCINRDRSVDGALQTLDSATRHREWIAGIGLDSIERDNPPIKFREVYDRARAQGYRLTAHCDVDQHDAVKHIWQCLDELRVDRIDHGINCLDDPRLVEALAERGTCLTACPTWRPRDPEPRRVHRIRQMFVAGLRVTLNSDDPGVFVSGSLGHLLPHAGRAAGFTLDELAQLSIHAFEGAWIAPADKREYISEVKDYLARFERLQTTP